MSRVLIVEDDVYLSELYARHLRAAGYEVFTVGDGLEALRAAPVRYPDVILMDLGLPLMDGWEATRILKRDPRTADIPVIAVTGRTMKTCDADARSAGCDEVLHKPCEEDGLLAAVRRFARP
jgi:two-component system, cell cycle response regulator DivK